MTDKQLTAGIIGSGFIGQVHIEALLRNSVRVKSLCGSQRAKDVATKWRIPNLLLDYDYRPMLDDPEIDVIHITSPNKYHHRTALDCIAAGKHVVCEKPLAMTTHETREIVEAAEKSDRVFAVNYNVRFYPLMLQLKAMIRKGELGRIIHLNGSYFQDWLLYKNDFNWRVLADEGGKLRAVGDVGTHWMDLASFVTGLKAERVWSKLHIHHKTRLRPTGPVQTFTKDDGSSKGEEYSVQTDDFANVILAYEGGAMGNLAISQVASGRSNCIRIEVYGEKKSIAWNSERPNEMEVLQRGERNQVVWRDQSLFDEELLPYLDLPPGHNEGFDDSFKMLYRNIYKHIEDPNTPVFYATAAEGHNELAICDAIIKSDQSGQWQDIDY